MRRRRFFPRASGGSDCIIGSGWDESQDGCLAGGLRVHPYGSSGRSVVTKWACILLLTAALVLSTAPRGWSGLQEYRDYSLGSLVMIVQSILYDEAELYVIGESSTPGIYQTAMLISENAGQEDRGLKNAVLFECGMHGREWYAAETCYWLIDYLLQNCDDPVIRELLANVDVWVIPQSNPAGRFIDDFRWGDPTQFAYVCDAGDADKIGDPCTEDSDCGAAGVGHCYTNGWRANANRTSCGLGVDPARNFSSGWEEAADLCDSGADRVMKYRGPHPFSEMETLNLRRFVHNHMLSMVVISHTNGQQIWNDWMEGNQATHYTTDWLLDTNFTEGASYTPNPAMVLDHVGGGSGQFSAWLNQRSDVLGEPDFAAQRNISTYYFELPFKGDAGYYYDTVFQNSHDDGSNSFHPSGDTVKLLWEDAIRPLLQFLILQARSPQCPVSDTGGRLNDQCEAKDFGLVGGKISDLTDQPGLLTYDSDSRWEILPKGSHKIVFAVQNFSSSDQDQPPRATQAAVGITKDNAAVAWEAVDVLLEPGERSTYAVDYEFDIGDYAVSILLDPDDFNKNNLKIFKFRVPSPFSLSYRVSLGTTLAAHIDPEGKVIYNGRFYPDQPLDPMKADLKLVLYGHRAHLPGSQPGPTSVSYLLPKGSPWWDKSMPEKGFWVYSDPKGLKSAVTSLRIDQSPKSASDGKSKTKVSFTARDEKLKALIGAQSYRFDLDFTGAGLRLSSLAQGTRPKPLKRPLPGDETEEEPYSPPNYQD